MIPDIQVVPIVLFVLIIVLFFLLQGSFRKLELRHESVSDLSESDTESTDQKEE